MKLLFVLLLVLLAVFVAAAPAAQKNAKRTEPLVVNAKQRRRMANDLKQYHAQRAKAHKNYIPYYPDDPILTIISIGTPSVDYWVSMESGSEATFVLAKDYPGRNISINQPFFDPNQSSSAKYAGDYQAFSADLEVFGDAYDDVVGLFGFGVWYNTTQRFGVVNDVYDPYWYEPSMPDGVVGLSWDPEDAANPNENSSAIINLFQEFGDLNRFWCQWLEDVTQPEYGRMYSMVTSFGGCLEGMCADATADNTYPLLWLEETRSLAFIVDSISYNGQQYYGGSAKVDTGAPNILLPADSFYAIYYDVYPSYSYEYGVYLVSCDLAGSLPDWVFTIGSKSYSIPSSAYIVDLLLPDNQCVLSTYMSDAETTDIVFGYVFHNLWCIKMDIDNQAISILDVIPPTTDEPELA